MRVQHILIKDAELVGWFLRARARARAAGARDASRVWCGSPTQLRTAWRAAIDELGLSWAGYSLSSLRAGGATAMYLQGKALEDIRWRGGWRQSRTLERYVQECTVWLVQLRLPAEARQRVSRLAGALRAFSAYVSGEGA